MAKTQFVILLALLSIIIAAWFYLFYQHWQMMSLPMSEMWMPPTDTSDWQFKDFALVYVMWAVMMGAMMLPSAIPMILAFSRICKQRYLSSQAIIFLFVLTYLMVWFGFSIVLTLLQWQMHGLHFLTPMMDNQDERIAAVIFLLAGIYQFTPLKHTFLQNCRSPIGFLLTEWRAGAKGAFYMGLKHGGMCLGCCWLQMLIMFAVGIMNLLAMLLITLLVLVEKITPANNQWICRAAGFFFIGWGIGLLLMGS